MDKSIFLNACDKILTVEREKRMIGTLGEKTLHAILKNYYEPDETKHEIKIKGYYADISNNTGITEIQTGNFNVLRKKLDVFLELSPVTLVYPIPYIKWLLWMEEETGRVVTKRKSPKKGTPYMAFPELYKIKQQLTHPNLSLCIVLINMEEYKVLNGWSMDKKRGASRYDRIPIELVDEINITGNHEYEKLIPSDLEREFTSKDFKLRAGLSLSAAQIALNVLHYVGAVERVGKVGRAYLYKRTE